jgi:NADPH-dependent 2,4-dienoyl-CoA reductase/sulfur reductase-like enzyme
VGDCAESIHIVTQKPVVQQLGTVAVRQGKVAGINAAGGYALFTGVIGSAVTQLYDMQIGATGLTEDSSKKGWNRNGYRNHNLKDKGRLLSGRLADKS